jgi:cell wall-associated NlpC family hydrolase/phage tail protein X
MVFLTTVSAFSQEKYTNHTVSKGETITQIAAYYAIKASAIYEINPEARKGIKFKSVLLIPTKDDKNKHTTSDRVAIYPAKKYTVLPKETLYAIAKQYRVTVEELYNANPGLQKSGLRKGDRITIPGTEANQFLATSVAEQPQEAGNNTFQEVKTAQNKEADILLKSNETKELLLGGIEREVAAHETKYAIAKEYGITIAALNAANPILEKEALKIGQIIIIPVNEVNNRQVVDAPVEIKKEAESNVLPVIETKNLKVISENSKLIRRKESIEGEKAVVKNENPVIEETLFSSVVLETEVVREVLAKETKYGIAKEFGISVRELERQNPKIVRGLPIGVKLNIRSTKPVETLDLEDSSISDGESGNSDSKYTVKSFHGNDFLDQLVSTASENIGSRYRTGGTTKDGFDCSGLMCTTFGAFDIQLPRTSIEQSQFGVKIENEDAQKGDLIFFKTNGRRQINHVGMVVEAVDGDIKFIHASVSGGVMISSIKEKYYRKKLSQINRVF